MLGLAPVELGTWETLLDETEVAWGISPVESLVRGCREEDLPAPRWSTLAPRIKILWETDGV